MTSEQESEAFKGEGPQVPTPCCGRSEEPAFRRPLLLFLVPWVMEAVSDSSLGL